MFQNSSKYLQFVVAFLATAFTILQGIDWLFSKMNIEGDYSMVLLVILLLSFFVGLFIVLKRHKKAETMPQPEIEGKKRKFKILPILNIGVTVVLAGFFIYYFQKGQGDKNLLDVKLPEIIAAYDNNELLFVYSETKKLLDAENENPLIKSYFEKVTEKVSIFTEPANVAVSFQVAGDTTDTWESIGITPIDSVRMPSSRITLKFTLDGKEYTSFSHPYSLKTGSNIFILPKNYEEDENFKVFLGGTRNLSYPGVDHLPKVKIGPYSMSLTEVSNKDYKAFVDAGGYNDPKYWDLPAVIDGKEMDFTGAMAQFTDQFGQAGPANWSYGNFPEGQENYPVTGICWYEARAYARFREMDLPNVYQWASSALLAYASAFVPNSNFSRNQLVEVGSLENKNPYGLLDVAGNVREWVINSVDERKSIKAILGGAFTDDPYFFNDFYGQHALDRSVGNGMRLVKNLEEYGEFIAEPEEEVAIEVRDFLNEEGVSDDVFALFRSQFDCEPGSLDAEIMSIPLNSGSFKVDRFEIASPYEEGKKLPGYVFYDGEAKLPLKPIIYFPGSGAIHLTNTDLMIRNNLKSFSYLLKEGYALFLPIYLGTYERADDLKSDYPNESESYKEHVISWGKDYKRTIDYIASREDMDMNALSYFGVSWGGFMANTLLAIDDRVNAAVLYVAGLCFQRSKKEVEAFHYTSRITVPVLMMNGKFDHFFPLETSQTPMFKLLSTKEEDKKHYVFETGHFVPKEELIKEHLAWLKKYE